MPNQDIRIDLIDPRDLLHLVKQHPSAAPFNLSLYTESHDDALLQETVHTVCDPTADVVHCSRECYQAWRDLIDTALRDHNPQAFACPEGQIGFAVPLPGQEGLPDCLLGGGLRAAAGSTDGIPAPAGEVPVEANLLTAATGDAIAAGEAQEIADEIHRLLPRLFEQRLHATSLARTTQRLEAVRAISHDLVSCTTDSEALALASEALVVIFNLPRLIVLRTAGDRIALSSTLGLAEADFSFDSTSLTAYLDRCGETMAELSSEDLATFFPGLKARVAHCLPMTSGDRRHGALLLLDIDLHSRDQALIELLVNHLTARLERLRLDDGHSRERHYSSRLVSMISALSLVDSREKLLQDILAMSAELLVAQSGSLMLLDEIEGVLKIAAAKGMSPSLARSMVVPFGEGIAGRVAKAGFPMLVNDIERDARTASLNRPRFRTKSFISIPLKINDRLIGVLNLADKADTQHFTEADLNLVQTFTGHAVQMIDRAAALEQAGQYEILSVTDSLTGLYNRRFLEARLQEEINRCQRQNQSFCVILADLDNFKLYNDVCGHLAGDQALRKAATLMRRTAREMDVVTRYGGEEFCLVLPGTGKKESVFVGERIRRMIDSETFPGEHHLPLGRLTISLGISCFDEDAGDADRLIHAADLALYRAKALGRNRLVLYEPGLKKQSSDLRRAGPASRS